MKKYLKTITLFVFFACILAINSFASIQSSAYIFRTSAQITALGNGEIEISFSVRGTKKMDDIGAEQIKLYSDSGELLETYTLRKYPDIMGHNTVSYIGSVTYSGTSGQKYYAEISVYAADSDGSDSRVITTASTRA